MIIVLVGPTAVGKSSLAVEVAATMINNGRPAEIVNADSMLVYRGMDIGTAKPTMDERGGITHHLIDVLDISDSATVADFQQMARTVINSSLAAGVTPILVGGSFLYVRAIVDEFSFPGTDPDLRAELEAELEQIGAPALHARLAARDPEAAASILPTNGRRIVRALEVIMITGEPYSGSLPSHQYALPDVVQVGVDAPRDWLDERIERRVQQMWADGFVDEVRRLEAAGLREARTARVAIGYRQVLEFLAGEITEAEAMRRTVVLTRRFSRKQGGWYRRDDRVHWLDARTATAADVITTADRALA
ncbi:tRNA (adenosine(37)-N6)-dimethylallyltransferase MiaA [Propionibacteriaceae bacterium Y1685]|uniref:tRNA (adenosine(37)-N6)-dimethylallyltransferase MiaA n=1 Tax=Microlunatus sp. Y1700 TaxID=3418487 RepID=UPI003B819973